MERKSAEENKKEPYQIRVDHPSGLHSFYDMDGNDYLQAEGKAKEQFMKEFGFKERGILTAFTFNKYRTFDEIPWAEELREGLKNA